MTVQPEAEKCSPIADYGTGPDSDGVSVMRRVALWLRDEWPVVGICVLAVLAFVLAAVWW